MFNETGTLTSNANYFDVCIIGAGAAGISLATDLSREHLSICLIEGGDSSYTQESQSIYKGESRGYSDLDTSRLRFLGGTTNHWTGYCRAPSQSDFEKRAWLPFSGWPIDKSALDDYIPRAAKIVEVPDQFDINHWKKQLKFTLPPLTGEELVFGTSVVGPPVRFREKYSAEIQNAQNINCYLKTNVVDIISNDIGNNIDKIIVSDYQRNKFEITSKIFILASGGIENARILLNSSSDKGKGLGNKHDQVGRYFSDHRIMWSGRATLSMGKDPSIISKLGWDTGSNIIVPHLSASRSFCKTNQCPQVMLRLEKSAPSTLDKLKSLFNDSDADLQTFSISAFAETVPDRNNRITLNNDRDSLGLKRVSLEYKQNNLETKAIVKAVEALGTNAGITGMGRVQALDEDELEHRIWGNHHYCTTRMSTDPELGVVDSDCKIHGYNNMFVAGSSVFPCSGIMTPTMTIVALSLRLSDKIKSQLSNSEKN